MWKKYFFHISNVNMEKISTLIRNSIRNNNEKYFPLITWTTTEKKYWQILLLASTWINKNTSSFTVQYFVNLAQTL